ncbi:MAG: PhoH family protein [Cellvibrionales bacterium TMED49]|nr:PhoH family protein [Porticoccaceae bacterium]OUU39194.1 MAG: PhoH family protein [Cellvibrionales bacterium TMED49]
MEAQAVLLEHLSHQPAATAILEPSNSIRLAALCGQLDENIRLIEKRLNVHIRFRETMILVFGNAEPSLVATKVLRQLYEQTEYSSEISLNDVHLQLHQYASEQPMNDPINPIMKKSNVDSFPVVRTKKGNVKPRGLNQQKYVRSLQTHDVNFGIGPAGTGKTFLAVACAVEAMLRKDIEKLVLVRPAVEAGERLGFLPGDLAQKVDPYLRPLYDALHEMMGFDTVTKLQERNIIEIAPLAYMRGRTLNHAFIILDESQNTTREQMKMFLTRIGFGSTVAITGDMTQIDLPRGVPSGLVHACGVLKDVKDVSFTYFFGRDVVRHPIVQSIVSAYEKHEKAE